MVSVLLDYFSQLSDSILEVSTFSGGREPLVLACIIYLQLCMCIHKITPGMQGLNCATALICLFIAIIIIKCPNRILQMNTRYIHSIFPCICIVQNGSHI